MPATANRLRSYAIALLLFLGVALLYTFPRPLQITTHFIGSPGGDKFQFIWNFWWVRHALFDLGQLPFFCPVQYYPTGVSLALHDTTYFWSLLSVPLQSVFDPRTILNLFLLGCFPLNAMAFYHLAREVSGSHRGALIGSLLFAFCPYLVGRYYVGHIQYLGVFTIPLFLLEIYRYFQMPRLRHAVYAGIYFCLTALISYYSAAELMLILAACIVYRCIAARGDSVQLKTLLFHGLVFGMFCVGVLAIFIVPALLQILQGDYRLAPATARHVVASSADLITYFIPDTTLASWKGWQWSQTAAHWAQGVYDSLNGNILEKSVYAGWTSIIAFAIALVWKPLRRSYWPWVVLAGSFFILSLGPTLHVKGTAYLENLMPYRLVSALPLFDIMRSPSRFAIFITLGGGLVVAGICRQLKQALNYRAYNLVALGLALFVLFEFLPAPAYFTPHHYYRSPYYHRLQIDPGRYSILNIPVDFSETTGRSDIYIYAQTIHAKPIIGGYVSREPHYALETLDTYPILKQMVREPGKPLKFLTAGQGREATLQKMLTELKVGRIILHRALLTPQEQTGLSEQFQSILGAPVFQDQWIIAFKAEDHSQ